MGNMIEINESQSARLQRIASEKGVTPNALLEEALELLFQQADREQAAQEEQAFLHQLQAEGNISASARTRLPFNIEEITILIEEYVHSQQVLDGNEFETQKQQFAYRERSYEQEAKRIATEILGYSPDDYEVLLMRDEPAGALYDIR